MEYIQQSCLFNQSFSAGRALQWLIANKWTLLYSESSVMTAMLLLFMVTLLDR